MEAAGFNPYNSFNSTLVQLKECLILSLVMYLLCFNSTLVQLKARSLITGWLIDWRFNSTLVQLKGTFRPYSLSFT
mgnify:CR=1 FL=1